MIHIEWIIFASKTEFIDIAEKNRSMNKSCLINIITLSCSCAFYFFFVTNLYCEYN